MIKFWMVVNGAGGGARCLAHQRRDKLTKIVNFFIFVGMSSYHHYTALAWPRQRSVMATNGVLSGEPTCSRSTLCRVFCACCVYC